MSGTVTTLTNSGDDQRRVWRHWGRRRRRGRRGVSKPATVTTLTNSGDDQRRKRRRGLRGGRGRRGMANSGAITTLTNAGTIIGGNGGRYRSAHAGAQAARAC